MVHFCSVPQCRGKWRSGYHLRFHAFPKDEESCKLWQKAIGRLKPPSDSMKVCSRHFTDDDYQIFWSGCKRLKKCAVPSVYLPSKVDAYSQTCDYDVNVSSMSEFISSFEVESHLHSRQTTETPFQEEGVLAVDIKKDIKEELDLTSSMLLGTSESAGKIHFGRPESNDILNDSQFDYLSGISRNCFQSLFAMLTVESLTLPSCNIRAQDQLLLTLCKYRHNFSYTLLSIIFKINHIDTLAVFSFWTYHMYKTLKLHSGMAVKVEQNIQCSVSVGIVNVPVFEPSLCALQCKRPDTGEFSYLKSLVVIDDHNQSVLYCSKLYGQFTSDDCMLEDLEFQQCPAPSSLINLNRALNLSKIFPDKDIQVILSDSATLCLCSKGGESISSAFSSFLLTKQFPCLMELYKVLSEGIPFSLIMMSSEIFFNCMMLLNLIVTKGIDQGSSFKK